MCHNSNMSACVLYHSRELRWLRPQQRQQLHQPPPAASSAFPRAWFCPASAAFTVCHYHHNPTCGSTTTCLLWHVPFLPPFCTVCTETALWESEHGRLKRDCAACSEEDRGHCVTRCLHTLPSLPVVVLHVALIVGWWMQAVLCVLSWIRGDVLIGKVASGFHPNERHTARPLRVGCVRGKG